MKKCVECVRENIDKVIYCANCGAKLDTVSNKSSSSNGGFSGSVSNKSASANSTTGPVSNKSASSVPTPALNTLKRFIENDSSSTSSNRSSSSTSSSSSSSNSSSSSTSSSSSSTNGSSSNSTINQKTRVDSGNLKLCCCYVPVILFILFITYVLVLYGFAENFPITYGHSYEGLDSDGDGWLSFDEASQLDPTIPNEQMTKYFNEAIRTIMAY